jgi:hypothetical protein
MRNILELIIGVFAIIAGVIIIAETILLFIQGKI